MKRRDGAPPAGRPGYAGVDITEVSKRFGAVLALDRVSLRIEPGSIHALVGENGAGKSTLGKIIAGVIQPDSGSVAVSGEAVTLRSPRDALGAGIATIEQEISLIPDLTVRDNVFLGTESRIAGVISRRDLDRRWQAITQESGFRLTAADRVRDLPLGQRQQAEILRALSRHADLIVLDEPTAALNEPEVRALHETIRSVADRGASVLIVTHFLKEVLSIADTITVLRDGKLVRTAPAAEQDEESLIRAMLGRDLSAVFPDKRLAGPSSPVVLSGRDITATGVRDVSIEIRAGEIVGLAGLDGSGRDELARALYGDLALHGGTVTVGGTTTARPSPRRSLARGLSMIPASRRDDGLFPSRPVTENASITSLADFVRAGVVRRGAESGRVAEVLERLNVPPGRRRDQVATLSGGNQQKVLFARALLRPTVALIAHEPTRGVDIGAKAAIYALLAALAAEGMGIALISAEPEELIGLSHRVLVMRLGSVSAELTDGEITEKNILTAALSGASAASPHGAGLRRAAGL